ncbi:hypothetical protein CO659_25380 [Rhizobium sp. S9]|nr:hypothetical protein CO659_25380 [Rhizobium sp. S9]
MPMSGLIQHKVTMSASLMPHFVRKLRRRHAKRGSGGFVSGLIHVNAPNARWLRNCPINKEKA